MVALTMVVRPVGARTVPCRASLLPVRMPPASLAGAAMDFLKILRSLEEFLYEVMSWLAFFPRTLLRILLHPVAVSRYAAMQLRQPKDSQFAEMISPPLMLILSILVAHGLEMVFAATPDYARTRIAGAILGSEQGLLAFRSICFSLYALLAAIWVLLRTNTRI